MGRCELRVHNGARVLFHEQPKLLDESLPAGLLLAQEPHRANVPGRAAAGLALARRCGVPL
eukprot:7284354-Alexandrium_andersonii.AAC.1